jgi:hypothetical protein
MLRGLSTVRSLLALIFLLGLGCTDGLDSGSSGLIPAPLVDVNGKWTGIFSSDDATHSGTVEAILVHDLEENEVTGISTFTTIVGPPDCWDSGAVAMQFEGITLSGEILRFSSPGITHVVEATLDALANEMSGTYLVRQVPTVSPCFREEGIMELTR